MRSIRIHSLLFVLVILGCSDPVPAPMRAAHSADQEPRYGGTLRYASFAALRSLDPALGGDGLSAPFMRLLFAGLIDYDEAGQLAPDLARSWDVLEEGSVYRFALREGVRMHDGNEFDASDIKRSVERALHPKTPNPLASYYSLLEGYDDFATGKAEEIRGIRILGKYLVEFRLTEPDSRFLPLVAITTLRPTCRSAGSTYDERWHPCGAGPFRLPPDGFLPGIRARAVRHDSYFVPGLPYLDAIEILFNVPPLTQRIKFARGDLDYTHDLSSADTVRYVRDSAWTPFSHTTSDVQIQGESMNTEMPPFDNVEVRRAVACAIDREALVKLKPRHMSVLTGAIPFHVPGYSPEFEGQRFDLPQALEHMKRAGYPYDPKTGQGGYPVTIPYLVYPQGLLKEAGQVVQQQLARIGIRTELRLVSWASYLALTQRRNTTALSPQAWQQDYPDASSFFEPLFGSAAINDTESSNSAFYKNPALDSLLIKARREFDPNRRREIYREANRIVRDDAPWAFEYSVHYFELTQPYVRGYKPHPIWNYHFARVWRDRDTTSRTPIHRGDR